jgi:hypothetical protein
MGGHTKTMRIPIKAKYKPPPLKFTLAAANTAVSSNRRKGFEVPWATIDAGQVLLPIPEEIDPDGALGQQLAALLRKDISSGLELSDFDGKEAFLLLAAKRASGGKFAYSIEAVLAPELVQDAASSLPETPATTTETR